MERKKTARKAETGGGTAVMDRPAPTRHDVELAAYGLFVKRGSVHGNDWQDWFEAEKAVYHGKKV